MITRWVIVRESLERAGEFDHLRVQILWIGMMVYTARFWLSENTYQSP